MKFAPTAFSITSYAFHVEQLLNGSGDVKASGGADHTRAQTPQEREKAKAWVERLFHVEQSEGRPALGR
jgi:hypothetical protein